MTLKDQKKFQSSAFWGAILFLMWGDDLIYDVAQLVLVKCSNFPLGLEPDVVPADDSVLHAHNGQSEGKTSLLQHNMSYLQKTHLF